MEFSKVRQRGFSAVEAIIMTIITSFVILLVIPTYVSSVKRAAFTVVIQAAETMREPVVACAEALGTVNGCRGDKTSAGKVSALTVQDGVITAVGNDFSGNYTYVLTPDYNSKTNQMLWTVSGTCIDAGACSA